MVVGFNHNFRYKGGLYHVQTEDGGLKSPNIVTLLYSGGTILASQKTSYADITKVNNLSQVVEDLMKEQHKEMLRRLKDGEFDDRLEGHQPIVNPAIETATAEKQQEPTPVKASAPVVSEKPEPEPPLSVTVQNDLPVAPVARDSARPHPARTADKSPMAGSVAPAKPAPIVPPVKKETSEPAAEKVELGLDDIIFSYLVGDDEK